MPVAGDEAEELILRALGEETHIVFFRRILGGDNGVGLFIVDLLELVDVGTGEAAVLVPPVDRGGGSVLVEAGEILQPVGGQEVREQSAEI